MDGQGAEARSSNTIVIKRSHSPPSQQVTNGSKILGDESSRTQQSSTTKISPPASPSPRRTSRSRASKDTQSPDASQPASRKSSPHKESAPPSSDAALGPSPYGTRSRNRTGTARPNYAEDRDDQMEFEYSSKLSQTATPAPSSKAQSPDMQKSSSSQGRKVASSSKGATVKAALEASTIQTVEGGGSAGTSVLSTNGEVAVSSTAPSKKRKALSSSVTVSAANVLPPTKRRASAMSSSILDRASAMPTFDGCKGQLASDGSFLADDGTAYRANDYVYLVCEPPGEPYYIARIMEFLHANNKPSAPIDEIRINWIYRPRDIGRKATDTRVLFASMHSDPCPITSLRGKCNVRHRNEIDDFDKYRKGKDNFYFSQMYDRYMRRYYELIPMKQVINVPDHIKKALDERWDYVSVEIGRGKELTSAVKTCKRCSTYCANNDSVDCAVCKLTYHMQCVQPPLLKKPSRGFGWSCGPCSRKQERKLEARATNLLGDRKAAEDDDEEIVEEEEEPGQISAPRSSSPESIDVKVTKPKATREQRAQAELWPYRYLGIHCKIEDSLDYDDRIYPRSSSRMGPRHQANVNIWHGHPIEYVKTSEVRNKYGKGNSKATEEERKAKEKRPKWVLDEPKGFVRRGEDHPIGDPSCTAQLFYKSPPEGDIPRGLDDGRYDAVRGLNEAEREKLIDQYMKDSRSIAESLNLKPYHTNFLDRALQLLYKHNFNADLAKKELRSTDIRKDLKEPKLGKEEQRKFEEAITKYGSNMVEVSRHIGKAPRGTGDVVRHYYMWKKTPRGAQIWSSYEGRKPKKKLEQPSQVLADDLADDHDDSAFDNDKAGRKKRGFECKHCGTRNSRFWRRAPGAAPGAVVPVDAAQKAAKDKSQQLMVALCSRCAGLYRKYGVHWEDIEDVAKRFAQAGGRAFKRKQDEELLIELINVNEEYRVPMAPVVAQAAAQIGMEISQSLVVSADEAAKKKKADKMLPMPEKDLTPVAAAAAAAEPTKKKVVEKPPEPPLVPEQPRLTQQPCAVCMEISDLGQQWWICRHCRLTVHENCRSIKGKNPNKWLCSCCMNNVTQQYSTNYECVLCPVRSAAYEPYEQSRTTHKKKSEREREKERLEKILVQEATNVHNKRQEEMGWPLAPYEALTPTANNNWAHITCALFTPQIKFRDAGLLDVAEGINLIPPHKFSTECMICKTSNGATVSCSKCPNQFHVVCAQTWNYVLGFDITPVKGSRKDAVTTVQMGDENGTVEAVIICRDHTVKNRIHLITEPQEDGSSALQLYSNHFKQADLSLTGTVRKAAAITSNVRNVEKPLHRRGSMVNGTAGTTTRAHRGSSGEIRGQDEGDEEPRREQVAETMRKECHVCKTDASPRWHERAAGDYTCHRCHVQNLKQAPSPLGIPMLPPMPSDVPPVSTPAQPHITAVPPIQQQQQQQPAPQQQPTAFQEPGFDARQPQVHKTWFTHTPDRQPSNTAQGSPVPTQPQQHLPRLGGHASPPLTAGHGAVPPHMPPPGHPAPMPPGLRPSPMAAYSPNGIDSARRDVPGPLVQQGPPPPQPPQMQPPHGSHLHASHLPQGPGHPPNNAPPPHHHQPPYLPALNRGPALPPSKPEVERRYSQPGPVQPTVVHNNPPYGHSRPAYSHGPIGPAVSPPYHAAPSPVSMMRPPHGSSRDMNGISREASMGPPRGADPFADGHRDRSPPREKLNGASASPSLKNLLH